MQPPAVAPFHRHVEIRPDIHEYSPAIGAMPTIYIHVGPHKTATSSIQDGLKRYRQKLLSQGIYFPLLPGPSGELCENHSPLIYSLFGDDPKSYHVNVAHGITTIEGVRALNEKYREFMIEEAHRCVDEACSTIIFSGEDMILLGDSGIRRLKNFMLRHFGSSTEVKVVFYVRAPHDWFASLVQQWVKGGEVLKDVTGARFFDIKAKLAPFCRHFGRTNIMIGKYEEAIEHQGGPTAHFLSRICEGFDVAGIRSGAVNVGLCAEAVHIVSALNEVSRVAGAALPIGVPPNYVTRFSQVDGAKFVLPEAIQRRVWAEAGEGLRWLEATFGVALYGQLQYVTSPKAMWSEGAILSMAKVYWEAANCSYAK